MQRVMTILSAVLVCGSAAIGLGTAAYGVAAESKPKFTLTPDEYGMVLKTPDGRTMFRYMTKKPEDSKLTANSVCCLYPVKTPSGEDVVDFAPSDHPHHRGVFLAWHAMAGKQAADFWGWGEWAPTKDRVITNRSIKLVEATADHARLAIRNDWTAEGTVMIEENLTLAAKEITNVYLIQCDFRLTPKEDITLKQTAFGGFCVKCRKDGKAIYTGPNGTVNLPPPHHLKPESDWPSAAGLGTNWYDYSITLESGKTVGIAVLDVPGNPPTLWHNLAPIAMINPCIVAQGPVTLKKGAPLRLRYWLVVHDGPAPRQFMQFLPLALKGIAR